MIAGKKKVKVPSLTTLYTNKVSASTVKAIGCEQLARVR